VTTPVSLDVVNDELLAGIVEARGVPAGPASAALAAEIDAALAQRAGVDAPPEHVKSAIRDLLRKGGYKPTGRGKPASEYLAQAAARGEFPTPADEGTESGGSGSPRGAARHTGFPRISHVVDALNLVSLDSGLPISLLDTDLATAGTDGLVLRLGHPGEKYVFNAAGQEIDVAGLLCVARAGGPPIGNPVKDSMATKTTPATRNVLAVIWASRRVVDAAALTSVCDRLARLLGAAETSVRVLG
jgi:DNA/RNA-binding domain of Phe-tRNA-synthetase-like protein